jgi:type II secretory pathway pseudopilin PulG
VGAFSADIALSGKVTLHQAGGKKMKKALLILGIVLLGAAYVAGYWPQRQKLQEAEKNSAQAAQQLSSAQAVVHITRLENDLVSLVDQTQNQNYGEAQRLSSRFFDDLRGEMDRSPNAPYHQALEIIFARRDAVTSGLTRADAATIGPLRQSLNEVRQLSENLVSQVNL